MFALITGEDEVQTSPKQKTPESRKKSQQFIKTPTETLQNKVAVERAKTPNQKKQKNLSLIEKQQQKTPSEKQQQKNKTPNEKQQQKNKTPNEKQQQKNKTPNEKQQQGATQKSSPGTPGTQVNVILLCDSTVYSCDTVTT
jgi:hypothetical protein